MVETSVSKREMEDLYALDFDGVLCDSCGESSLSAVKAAKVRWPSLFQGVDSALEEWIVEQMHIVRPVVETGYENLLLVRLLLETKIPSIRKSSVSEGLNVDGILEGWGKIKPVIMEAWEEDKDELVDLFGKVRDDWIKQDLTTWIGANRFYPGVSDALKFASSKIYIVTTKQGRFAEALLREIAGVIIPSERVYGLGSGPKVEVLKLLQNKPEHQGLTLHFVEDRLATLKNVIKEPELDKWNLYLGNWGYNTEKERAEAASIPRIQDDDDMLNFLEGLPRESVIDITSKVSLPAKPVTGTSQSVEVKISKAFCVNKPYVVLSPIAVEDV